MKKILLILLSLLLCLTTCLSFFACKKDKDNGDNGDDDAATAAWRAAFTFENVRVDCTKQYAQDEPVASEPLCGGTHYLLTKDHAAIANVAQTLPLGEIAYITLYKERSELLRLFDFSERFKEFTKQDDNTYVCETSSLKGIIKDTDHVENVTIIFAEGRIATISYHYYRSSSGADQLLTFTFSQYGQVQLEQPTP